MAQANAECSDLKERLIATVKREVKQLMEEAVTKRLIYEESSSVIKLCAAVETCLNHGLRRRALGLFKTSSTTALMHKIAKNCPEAEYISKMVRDIEASDSSKKSSSSSDSFIRPPMLKKGSTANISLKINSPATYANVKYLWIRLALYEKRLAKIIEYLVTNANTYYDRESLVADSDYGSILSSLLVGPCALDFSRSKKFEHSWNDPHADELVQRHRISSGRRSSSTSSRQPIINFRRSLNTSSDEASSGSFKPIATATVAKDYVESLHQNSKAVLLYGKNNVQVLPKDVTEPMLGYLSLHQHMQTLTIKWTPNQLMNVGDTTNDAEEDIDNDAYWNYALNVNIDDIVYVHCHHSRLEESGGTIILVGHDGVQRPPIHFPEGGHMQQFLTCLETGLLPHGQLDPPLWSQKGIEKGFLWQNSLRKRMLPSVMESQDELSVDYVFRIVSKSKHEEFAASHFILDFVRSTPRRAQLSSCSTTGSSDCSNKSLSIDHLPFEAPTSTLQFNQNSSIEMVCSTMRRQIISRAFYGWLAYCRHLSTVRTHLSGLVHTRITPELKSDEEGLTKERWQNLNVNGMIDDEVEFYRLVYFGGMQPELRKDVWPYLLGHYKFGSTAENRQKQDELCKRNYETTMSEWLAVDAIVQQREKEKTARAVAKLSSGSNRGDEQGVRVTCLDNEELENEVFENISDISDPGDTEVDNEQQLQEDVTKTSISSASQFGYLTVMTTPRKIKTSTDSGHVDEAIDENDYQEKKNPDEGIEAQIRLGSTECIGDSIAEKQQQYPTTFAPGHNEAFKTQDFRLDTFPHSTLDKDEHFYSHLIEKVDDNEGNCFHQQSVDLNNLERSAISSIKNVTESGRLSEGILNTFKPLNSSNASPASSNGGIYSSELLEQFGLNLLRIEKDVQRCDRNFWYFANDNLYKLRNVISTYVWEHLDIGYMQGMCDLLAPLLVIFDDESLSYSCFCKLMERLIENFPSGSAMDMHFANMRSLIQILDSEMYDLMNSNGDYTHFYFCYRWFLLDFKREFVYDDIFATWEVIWAAKHIASENFVLFLALALLQNYRDIILSNSMDFTDVIKFFNEMAERHNAQTVLSLARSLVLQLQMIIENK